jgi:hypothetical protein
MLCTFSIVTLFYGCSENSSEPDNNINHYYLVASYKDYYYDRATQKIDSVPTLEIAGRLMSNTGNLIKNVKVENKIFDGEEYSNSTYGFSYFAGVEGRKQAAYKNIPKEFDIELNTDLFSSKIHLSIPDTLSNLNYNYSDYIPADSSFIFNWECSNGNFFLVNVRFSKKDSTGYSDTFAKTYKLKDNKLIIASEELKNYDAIRNISITPGTGIMPDSDELYYVSKAKIGFISCIGNAKNSILTKEITIKK